MNTIHLTGFTTITLGGIEGLMLQYKPDIPKLVIKGTVLFPETEDELPALLHLSQKQINQVFAGKDIDLIVQQDEWILNKPLTRDQIRKIGIIPLHVHDHGVQDEFRVLEVLHVG